IETKKPPAHPTNVTCSVSGCTLVFLTGFWLTPLAFGQAQQFEGRPIVDIQYEPAQQPVAPQDLERIQPLKKGTALRISDVAAAIDGLYTTGRYRDIQVDAEPSGNGVI